MNCSEAFALLKPICDKVVKKPNKNNLQDLQKTFEKISPEILLQLQEYVLYPLQLNLQHPNVSSEQRRYIVDCIKQLIHCTEVNRVKMFLDLFSLIFIQLFDKGSQSMVADVSEELKLSVIQCATKITQKLNDDVIEGIYKKENVPRISQGIFICVHIMQNERMRLLKIAAIEFIMAITQVDGEDKEFEIMKPLVADSVMFIVPGILTGLHKVVIGDEKQGHLVTKIALRAWSRILILVLEDIVIEKSQIPVHFSAKVTERVNGVEMKKKSDTTKRKNEKDSDSLMNVIQSQQRTTEWAQCVSDNVTRMSESLRSLLQHDNWKVRLELANACHSILDRCQHHIKGAFIIYVEILLNLVDDDSNNVSSTSRTALQKLSKRLEEECGMPFYDILKDNFYGLVTKLPRIIHIESDGDKLGALRLLKQYLVLLGPGCLPQVLRSSSHLQRTVLALLQVAELRSDNLTLLSNCSLRDLELNQDTIFHTPWKQFKHFADKSISHKLEEVLQLLGQNGDMEILSNHLLELLETDIEHRNEIVFILNESTLGGVHGEENIHLVKNMLDVYLSPELWYVPLTTSEDSSPAKTRAISQVRSNLQLACLLAEGVGNAASALGRHFSRFLMRCLYLVVERAGSPHEALVASGLKAAAAVAQAVGQGADITSLLTANMDYFTVQVSLRLRNLQRDPGVLGVLSVAMRHSSREMLPYLQNAVTDVLLQSCDTFQMHHTSSFLHVFYTFFVCIKRWFQNKRNNRKIQTEEPFLSVSFVVNDTLEYLKNSQICKEIQASDYNSSSNDEKQKKETSSQEEEENRNLEEEPSEEPKVPSHIGMTVSVLQRCLHLLPRKDKQCRVQALETVAEGLQLLARYEDELLPLVHRVWSPLAGQLQDASDPLLLNRSFALLLLLADLARDFIRTRTLKQVWPALCSFLLDSSEKSKNKSPVSAFQHSQFFKLQLHLLQGLGDLTLHLQLQEKEIYQMLSAAVPYLSSQQPKLLQENCISLFQTVATYNADAVWLEMLKIQKQITPRFKENTEYIKNVQLILEFVIVHERMEL